MPVVIREALSTAASGTQDITSSGVGTIAAAEFWCVAGTADDTSADDAYQSYGFTDGTREASGGYASEHSPTRSNCSRNQRDDRVISFPNFAGSGEEMGFSFDSFITDGVRLTIDTQASAAWYVVVRLWTDAEISDAYVDSVTLNASTSALNITAPGFEPDLVKTVGSSLNTALPHVGVNILWFTGMGINDGSDTQKSIFLGESDDIGTSAAAARVQNAVIAGQMNTNGTMPYTTVIEDYDSSGFSLTSAGTPQADILSYLALKFEGTPQLALLDVDWPTSGNINEETPAFQPDTVEMLSGHFLAAYNTGYTTTVATTAITVFDDTNIFTNQTMIEDASALMDTSSRSSSKVIIRNRADASTIIDSSGYSLDSLGYNITLTTWPGTAGKAFSLSIKTDPASGGSEYTISGDVTTDLTPAAALAYNQHPSITGAITVSLTPAAAMTYGSGYLITGDITATVTPAATLQYNQNPVITGDLQLTLTPSAGMEYTTPIDATIVGDVTLSVTPTGVMLYAAYANLTPSHSYMVKPEQVQFTVKPEQTQFMVRPEKRNYTIH